MQKVISLLFLALVVVTCVSAQSEVDFENRCAPKSDQSYVAVYLEVPEFIETGLTDGTMERVAGVFRYSDDKQVIAWLRQGGQVGQVAESTAGLLEHITRLSGGANLALGRLLASVTPFLNISMAGFSLIEHIAGIRAHEAELERIYDRVSEEFQRDRRLELLAALDYAENTFLVNSDEYKWAAVAEVNSDLAVARKQLIEDLEILLSAEIRPENMELAMNYQVLAMRVCALGTRLRLEIGENEAAIDWLSKCVSEQENHTRSFVNRWLGDSPALYFHESVSDEYLERYLDIERWLREKPDILMDVIKAYRGSFWNDEAIDILYTRRGINSVLVESPFYLQALPRAEILIENFQRLQGLELELKSMCFPFEEWESYQSSTIDNHDDYVMLVNDDAAES